MKKIYKPLSRLVTVLGILLLTATSCGSDDKKETPNEALQGLWRVTEVNQLSTETETSEATEDKTFYPDNEGIQPYIRFNTTSYERFEVHPTDTIDKETGSYTLDNNEITMLASGRPAKMFGYTISGKQLIMIEKEGELEMSTFAVKVDGDPFQPEVPDDNGDSDNPDDEAPTGCAIYHDANALEGSSLNPLFITTGEPIEGALLDVDGRNGYEARYYLQVEPYTAFRIHVRKISSTDTEVIAQFRYTTISVNDAFSTDQFIFNTDIQTNTLNPIHFDLFASSSCLYIEFFSYQKEVTFEFEVEDLSAEKE